jgi:hypothetical protein
VNLRRKAIVVGTALPLTLLALLIVLRWNPERRRLQATERRQWKENAIKQVNAVSRNTNLVNAEVTFLQNEISRQVEDGWIGTNIVLMTNGEYLVYSHIDTKQDSRIHDLLIAHGSNGKWYYSTFHFCINMYVPRYMREGQAGSISEFTNSYAVLEFDGKSDECLKKTWPARKR